MPKKITTAILPVGGLGTRFLPATKSLPKEMLPIFNKPLIQYAFEEASDAGIEKFIFITGRNKNSISNHFDHAYELESKLDEKSKINELQKVVGWMPKAGKIAFVRQQKPLGLGHAVLCAKNFLTPDENFVVILADELLLPDSSKKSQLKLMIEKFHQEGDDCSIIGVDEVNKNEVSNYGIVKFQNDQIIDMIEKPSINEAPSNLAINGRYLLSYKIFEYLEKNIIGSGGEIQLTDALNTLCKTSKFFMVKNNQKRFDCGNVLGYVEANIAFALTNLEYKDKIVSILKKYIN